MKKFILSFLIVLNIPFLLFAQDNIQGGNSIDATVRVVKYASSPFYIVLSVINYVLFLIAVLLFIINLFDFFKLKKRVSDEKNFSVSMEEINMRTKLKPMRYIFWALLFLGIVSFMFEFVKVISSFKDGLPVFLSILRNISIFFNFLKSSCISAIIVIILYLILEIKLERVFYR